MQICVQHSMIGPGKAPLPPTLTAADEVAEMQGCKFYLCLWACAYGLCILLYLWQEFHCDCGSASYGHAMHLLVMCRLVQTRFSAWCNCMRPGSGQL